MIFGQTRAQRRGNRLLSTILLGSIVTLVALGIPAPGTAATPHHRTGSGTQTLAARLAAAQMTATEIAQAQTPTSNLLKLTSSVRLHTATPIAPYVSTQAPPLQVGQAINIWAARGNNGFFRMSVTLAFNTTHAHWFVQSGQHIDLAALQRSATYFEDHIYPTDRANYGTEPLTGPNRDPRISIINGAFPGGIGGYFSAEDTYPSVADYYSNQQKMFYISTDGGLPGTDSYNFTLAHEFQHMIHYNMHPRDDVWINEGSSMLAQVLNGFSADGDDQSYLQGPHIQLNTWSGPNDENLIAHYGGGFLWMWYFYQHYGGTPALRALIANKNKTGFALFDDTLHQLGFTDTSTDMFRKWVVANAIDDPTLPGGWYGYRNYPAVRATPTQKVMAVPAVVQDKLPPYSTDYISVPVTSLSSPTLHLSLVGDPTMPLLSNTPSSGSTEWWSNRGDVMDTTLTRSFDLSKVKTATLNYSIWYELEQAYDYGYVEISTDGGQTWQTLRGRYTTTTNPNGANLGNGYNGTSSKVKGNNGGWLSESLDLSAYAGKLIQVRFEQVTDDADNWQGMAMDNLSIPQIGFSDSDTSRGGWQSNGWVRVANILPVHWLVQPIVITPQGTHILSMTVSSSGSGSIDVPVAGASHVLIAVSALAPATTQQTSYTLHITPGS